MSSSSLKILHGRTATLAVIFDMDGLLLDTESLSLDSFITTASRYNVRVGIDDYRKMIGLNAATGIDILRSILPAHLNALAFKNEWLAIYRGLIDDGVKVKAGAHELLHALQQAGVSRAVATSSAGGKARKILHKTGLLPLIEHVTGGDEVKAGKPAPDVYLNAAHKLGINPSDCLAIEDSENGVDAALGAGMTVIQIPDLAPAQRPSSPPQFYVVNSLYEAGAFLGLKLR